MASAKFWIFSGTSPSINLSPPAGLDELRRFIVAIALQREQKTLLVHAKKRRREDRLDIPARNPDEILRKYLKRIR
jgi:hypothetical protein